MLKFPAAAKLLIRCIAQRDVAMSKSYDATMRKLLELDRAAWLRFLHVPVAHPDYVREAIRMRRLWLVSL